MAGKKKEETSDEKNVEAVAEDVKKAESTAAEEKPKTDAKAKPAKKADEKAAEPKKAAKPKTAKTKAVKESKSAEVSDDNKSGQGKRAEKVGIVWSDKMEKTVVVRVERLFKHQLYHKYIKKRKKFMAHDELGASMGDRVRIVETRPLSARKRWRVVEIIQKAEK